MKELAKDMMMGSIAWWLLLAALAGIAVLWNLYLKEKRKTASEFVVYVALPLAEQSQIEEKENQEQETVRKVVVPDDFTLDGIHILLAEDNDINAEIAMEILEMNGAIVQRAYDGEEVVQIFKDSALRTYDVILMDIQMPQMNGWEATEVIRKLERADAGLPIFAMSANAFTEDQRHSLESGMNGHINKPVNYEEVRRMIGESMYARREGDRRWTNG